MDSTEKGLGVLSYFGPLFIITLIAGNSSFTKFHANQGLVLFIIEAIVGAVCGILGIIPLVGAILSGIIGGVFGLVSFAAMLYGIITAAQGEMKPIPVIGSITIIK